MSTAKTGSDASTFTAANTGLTPEAVEKFIAERRTVTREEVANLLTLARENGGELVHVTGFGGQRDPDDWCGTMWFRPPRRLGALVDRLTDRGWGVEIFPLGIINPDALLVQVRNQTRLGMR